MTSLTLDHYMLADRRLYQHKKEEIQNAIKGQTGILNGVTENNKVDIFYMLLFCLCVPQSRANKAQIAIDLFRKKDYYHNELTLDEITNILKSNVRFHLVKSLRIFSTRKLFFTTDFWDHLVFYYNEYKESDKKFLVLLKVREFLIEKVNGLGFKSSSHFLRNVGMSGLAILDVHILNSLKERGVIPKTKITLTKSKYNAIEQKMNEYASKIGMTIDELDLLFWSNKTGYVFK